MTDFVDAIDSRWLLLVLLASLDSWAIALTIASRSDRREKALWSGVILLCPIVGCLLWYVLGPKPNLLRSRKAPTRAELPAAPQPTPRR